MRIRKYELHCSVPDQILHKTRQRTRGTNRTWDRENSLGQLLCHRRWPIFRTAFFFFYRHRCRRLPVEVSWELSSRLSVFSNVVYLSRLRCDVIKPHRIALLIRCAFPALRRQHASGMNETRGASCESGGRRLWQFIVWNSNLIVMRAETIFNQEFVKLSKMLHFSNLC